MTVQTHPASASIPDYLTDAINDHIADPHERAKLIGEWITTLRDGEERAERIRAQVAAHPHGFFRHEGNTENGT
jgi:hypothetical protein